MRESQRQDDIVFEDRPIILPAILAAMSLVFAINLALRGSSLFGGEKEAIGVLLGALLCAFGSVLLFRRDRFAFDTARRQLRWRKWSVAGSSSGEIGFDRIVDVTLDSMSGSEGGGTYRVALRLPDDTLPLTEIYSGPAEDWRPVAERIREILGLDGARSADGNYESLEAQARKIDAVRQLCETQGPGLTEVRAKAAAMETRTD